MIVCDTSTLAKFYVNERESKAVRDRLNAEDQVFICAWGRAELMAVLHRQLREKKWNREIFVTVTQQFLRDDADGLWSWTPVDSELLSLAVQTYLTIPAEVFLRTADCVHLVSAIRWGYGDFYTHDTRQRAAAAYLGLNPLAI
jgi:predicted nucleic acid-binding protein